MNYTFIESEVDLIFLNRELLNKSELGIDTEFRRRSKNDLKLCLLQIRDDEEIYLIDCLKIKGTKLSCSFLSSEKVIKVFHSFKEDKEAINSWTDQEAINIFDTQLANAFLGGSFSISYKDLVKNLLGAEISKSETRSNWMRRPLSSSQLDYAASDVEFLLDLYFIQRTGLLENDKYNSLREETEKVFSFGKVVISDENKTIKRPSKLEEKILLEKFNLLIKTLSKREKINSTLLFSKKNQKDFYFKILSVGIEDSLKDLAKWKKNLLSKEIYKLFKKIV